MTRSERTQNAERIMRSEATLNEVLDDKEVHLVEEMATVDDYYRLLAWSHLETLRANQLWRPMAPIAELAEIETQVRAALFCSVTQAHEHFICSALSEVFLLRSSRRRSSHLAVKKRRSVSFSCCSKLSAASS